MSHIARHPKPPLTTTVLPQTTTKKFQSKRQIFLKRAVVVSAQNTCRQKTRFTLNAVVYSGLHVNVNPYFLQKYNIVVCLVCTSYTFAIVYVGFNLKKQARDGPYYN